MMCLQCFNFETKLQKCIIPLNFSLLNKHNYFDTELFGLDLSITIGIVSSKDYDKWNDSNFKIVNFSFLDEDGAHSQSSGV